MQDNKTPFYYFQPKDLKFTTTRTYLHLFVCFDPTDGEIHAFEE